MSALGQKQTLEVRAAMSAKGQEETSSPVNKGLWPATGPILRLTSGWRSESRLLPIFVIGWVGQESYEHLSRPGRSVAGHDRSAVNRQFIERLRQRPRHGNTCDRHHRSEEHTS